jgi:cytochrome c peroxidase
MYRKILFFILFIVQLGAVAAIAQDDKTQDDTMKKAQALFKPIPDSPPAIEGNELTPDKVKLGKMLYFEPRLSASDLISCNTCHNMATAGVDLQETSVGHAWQKGPRNAPTVLNSVFNIAQFWDGRAKDLAEQAMGPMQATVEMSNTPERVVETLKSMPEYVELFQKSFPGAGDPVTFDNSVKAIEVYESTLLTPDSPFDRYMKGDESALTAEQKEGLKLFMDKGCASCHNGINVGGAGYFPFGLVKKPSEEVRPTGDKGRFAVTKTESDEYVFKVPTLRNVTLTAPYFHSGKVWDLNDAVTIMGEAQLGQELNDEEVDKIVIFLGALTGKQPDVELPVLPPSTKDTPRPILEVIGENSADH